MSNFILKVFLCLLLFVWVLLKLYEVSIDEHLTYEMHVDKLCIKLSKRLGLLRHISPYLKKNQRIIYFNAVIKPLMMYASTVWTSCNKEVLERVLRMQKRAARIILESQCTSRTATLFNNLSWILFYNEAYIKRCELAFKRINGSQLPDYLSASLRKNSDVHWRTREIMTWTYCALFTGTSQREDAPLL